MGGAAVLGIDLANGPDSSVLSQMKVRKDNGKYLLEMVCYETIGRTKINPDIDLAALLNPWPDWAIAIEDEYDGPKDSPA